MSTFVYLGVLSLGSRFNEINLILSEAKKNSETNLELYNSLCRSAQVLLSAHFEGYLKDLVKDALEDINHYSNFRSTNMNLKRKYCEHFFNLLPAEKNSKESNQKIERLVSEFDSLDTKFKKEHFSYNDNNNPKASVLDKIADQFGVKDFFKKIKKSNLELAFSNTNSENINLRNGIKKYLLDTLSEYPYKTELDFLQIDENKVTDESFWDTFLSELLKRRHDIAHGKEVENTVGHSIIESDLVKIEILIYSFTAFICSNLKPIKKNV